MRLYKGIYPIVSCQKKRICNLNWVFFKDFLKKITAAKYFGPTILTYLSEKGPKNTNEYDHWTESKLYGHD